MLVDVGSTRRPDLQHAIQKMMAEPPVKESVEIKSVVKAGSSQRQSRQSNRRSAQSEIIDEVEEDYPEDFERDIRPG